VHRRSARDIDNSLPPDSIDLCRAPIVWSDKKLKIGLVRISDLLALNSSGLNHQHPFGKPGTELSALTSFAIDQ